MILKKIELLKLTQQKESAAGSLRDGGVSLFSQSPPILSFLIIDQVALCSQLKNRHVAGCYRFSATESDDKLSTHQAFFNLHV